MLLVIQASSGHIFGLSRYSVSLNNGTYPDDVELQVGSRIKLWVHNMHIDIGFTYVHPSMDGEFFLRDGGWACDEAGAAGSSEHGTSGTSRPLQNSARGGQQTLGLLTSLWAPAATPVLLL